MEHYWESSYMNKIGEVFRHDIKLYNHKSVSVILCSTDEFMKAFSKEFSQFGRFSSIEDNDMYKEGWIFKIQEQDRLTMLLKNIFNNSIKPTSDLEVQSEGNELFNTIINLMDMLKRIKKDSEKNLNVTKENIETTISFDNEKKEGEHVYSFECSLGKISIHQKEIIKENASIKEKENE